MEVSLLGLGTARLASLGTRRSTRDVVRLLDAAADLGVNVIDTADTYGSTACERRLGDAMRGRASRFMIATKTGLTTADLPGPLRAVNQPAKKAMQALGQTHRLEPAQLRHSIDASLRRLRRERLDFYFLHSPPLGVEHRDDLFGILDEAKRAGKVGAYGVSSGDTAVVAAVAGARHCGVAQTMVNPLTTHAVRAMPSHAADASSVELMASSVMAGRALISPSAVNGAAPTVAELARRLDAVSQQRGIPPRSLLVRHAAAVPNVKVVLVGTSDPTHLAENVAALEPPPSDDDLLA